MRIPVVNHAPNDRTQVRSYVLTGTQKGMVETFGSTCHGAGRAMSEQSHVGTLSYYGSKEIKTHGSLSVSSCPVMEEAKTVRM